MQFRFKAACMSRYVTVTCSLDSRRLVCRGTSQSRAVEVQGGLYVEVRHSHMQFRFKAACM